MCRSIGHTSYTLQTLLPCNLPFLVYLDDLGGKHFQNAGGQISVNKALHLTKSFNLKEKFWEKLKSCMKLCTYRKRQQVCSKCWLLSAWCQEMKIPGQCVSQYTTKLSLYRGADKSLARSTSWCILFDGGNISFDASLVIYINSTNIPPITIINRIYETQNFLSL